jgi:hypothetical protein
MLTVEHYARIRGWVSQKTQEVGEKLTWDTVKEEFNDNALANSMLARPQRSGYELPEV